MEIISFNEGAARATFAWDEVRPKEGSSLVAVTNLIQTTYYFQESGLSQSPIQPGVQYPFFKRGSFLSGEATLSGINSLEMLPDGLAASCSKTEFAEKLVSNVLDTLRDDFGYRKPPELSFTYQSAVISDLGFDLTSTLRPWIKVMEKCNMIRGKQSTYEPTSLRFMVPQTHDFNLDTPIAFEKRYNAPEGKYWFYSVAPLRSDDHVELLRFVHKHFGEKSK